MRPSRHAKTPWRAGVTKCGTSLWRATVAEDNNISSVGGGGQQGDTGGVSSGAPVSGGSPASTGNQPSNITSTPGAEASASASRDSVPSYVTEQNRRQGLLSGMQSDLAGSLSSTLDQTGDPADQSGGDPSDPGADPTDPSNPDGWRGVRELLPELGLSPDGYADDREALQGIAARALQAQQFYEQNQQLQRMLYEARQQQYAPQPGQQQQFVAGQQSSQQSAQQYGQQPGQPQPAPAKQVQPFLPALPEFDERSLEFLERDSAGNVVAKPGADPRLVQQFQMWNRAREQAVNKLVSDPQGYAEWVFQSQQDRVQQEIESRIEARLQAYHTENDARQYIAANQNKIFQVGQNGQVLLDPATGQPAFTPYGNAFYNGLQASANMGLNNYRDRVAYAEREAGTVSLQQQVALLQQQLQAIVANGGRLTPGQQIQPTAEQQAANQQRKQDFMKNNRGQVRKANRTATLAAAKNDGVPQNGQYRLHEMLTQGFRDEGLLNGN